MTVVKNNLRQEKLAAQKSAALPSTSSATLETEVYLEKCWGYVSSIVATTIEMVERKFTGTIKSVEQIEQTLISILNKLGFRNFGNSGFYNWIKNLDINKVLENINFLPDTIIQLLKDGWAKIVDLVKRFFEVFVSGVKNLKGKLADFFVKTSDALERLSDVFKNKVLKINFEKLPLAAQSKIEHVMGRVSEILLKLTKKSHSLLVTIESWISRVVTNQAHLEILNNLIARARTLFLKGINVFISSKNKLAINGAKLVGVTTFFIKEYVGLIDIVIKALKVKEMWNDENVDRNDTDINSIWYVISGVLIGIVMGLFTAALIKLGFVVAATVLSLGAIAFAGFELFTDVDLMAMGAAPYLKTFVDMVSGARQSFEESVANAARQIENMLLPRTPFPLH